jgi:glutamine amidotransferase
MKTLLIDYGSGNLRSAAKALEAAGFAVSVASDPRACPEASLLVLPGQGHFGQVMAAFRASGFVERVLDHIQKGLPFLGICVGMQILYQESEEAPGVKGLGLFPGVVRRFPRGRVPQMGWNRVRLEGPFAPFRAGTFTSPTPSLAPSPQRPWGWGGTRAPLSPPSWPGKTSSPPSSTRRRAGGRAWPFWP